jgi:hypothetical protein
MYLIDLNTMLSIEDIDYLHTSQALKIFILI